MSKEIPPKPQASGLPAQPSSPAAPPVLAGNPTNTLKLSDSEVPTLAPMALGLSDSLTQLWNLFMIINGAIVGWLFTTQKTFSTKEKTLATALYILFVLINFNTLHKMYQWLHNILGSVSIAASKVDDPEQELIRKTLMDVGIPGGKTLGYLAYILAFIAVLASIWV